MWKGFTTIIFYQPMKFLWIKNKQTKKNCIQKFTINTWLLKCNGVMCVWVPNGKSKWRPGLQGSARSTPGWVALSDLIGPLQGSSWRRLFIKWIWRKSEQNRYESAEDCPPHLGPCLGTVWPIIIRGRRLFSGIAQGCSHWLEAN